MLNVYFYYFLYYGDMLIFLDTALYFLVWIIPSVTICSVVDMLEHAD